MAEPEFIALVITKKPAIFRKKQQIKLLTVQCANGFAKGEKLF
jgi:hypothetical protein